MILCFRHETLYGTCCLINKLYHITNKKEWRKCELKKKKSELYRNEIKSYIVRAGMTMSEVVDYTQTELHSGTLSRKWRSNGTRSLQGGLLLPYPEKCRLKCVLRCCRNIAKSISCPKGCVVILRSMIRILPDTIPIVTSC